MKKLRVSVLLFLALFAATTATAEVRVMTLRQAVDMAMARNPDVLLARLEQQKARAAKLHCSAIRSCRRYSPASGGNLG
jgi:hypothetical protein